MSNYHGPAVIIFENGSELPVTANVLRQGGGRRVTWLGHLIVPSRERTAALMNLTQAMLRVGDRQAAFVRPDTSDWTRSSEGQFQVAIHGSGDAPF